MGTQSLGLDYPLPEVGIRVGRTLPPHNRSCYTGEHTHTHEEIKRSIFIPKYIQSNKTTIVFVTITQGLLCVTQDPEYLEVQ